MCNHHKYAYITACIICCFYEMITRSSGYISFLKCYKKATIDLVRADLIRIKQILIKKRSSFHPTIGKLLSLFVSESHLKRIPTLWRQHNEKWMMLNKGMVKNREGIFYVFCLPTAQ